MAYVSEGKYFETLRNKSVALVGSAASIEGTGYRRAIEHADVVVRVNNGAPVPERLWPDAGHRTDVLYHILHTGIRELNVREIEALGDAARLVVATRPQQAARVRRFAPYAEAFPWTAASVDRAALRARLGCPPNSGAVALAHLLRSPAAQIAVYGFDCYRTGHWVGQAAETPQQAAQQAGGTAAHDQAVHRAWFRAVERRHAGRLRYAPELSEALATY